MTPAMKKEPMRPRQHDATKAELRDARARKLSASERKELDRIKRITEESRLRRSHLKAKTKARNASREVFAEAMTRLDFRAKQTADKPTLKVDWEEIYSAARAVGHQADKLNAIKDVLRIEKLMEEKGFSIPKERTPK